MKRALALAAALVAAPALAQAPAAPPPAAAVIPLDPARVAAARPVIAKLWPLGTYKRMMDGMMDRIMQSTMSSMFGMKASDFAGMAGVNADKAKAQAGDKTLGQMAEAADPAFRERMTISTKIITDEMVGMMTKVEPSIQEALVRAYARHFTVAQLGDLDRFFATPTGREYAAQSMLLYADPEMVTAMQSFAPELMKAMPAIMDKVKVATAHLPPPPTPTRPSSN